MAKLIVEEGGARRAFRMGKGVLTVGSGAEARLKLASTAVAEIHFELELGEAGVKLRLRPGVVPPKVGGQPARGELVLAPGIPVEVGGARLWLEPEEGPAAAPAPAAAQPVRAAVAPVVPARAAPPSERLQRRRAEPRPGRVPGWLIPVLVLAATGILFLVWLRLMKSGASDDGLVQNKLRAAEQALAAARFDDARAELAGIPAAGTLTPAQAERLARVQERLETGARAANLHMENESGTRYLDAQLKKYEAFYLQGTPDPAKVRLFLKRCRTFRERWPRHPELDWVQRQETRFAGYVDMNAPPSWADVLWEVKDLTAGMPRNYVAAFALLDELLPRVSGKDRTEAEALRDELVGGRSEYAEDRLQQARHEFEKMNDPNKSVWWLVHNVAWLGDEGLANESARFLAKMPDLAGHLRGYKQDYPERYAAVLKNPVIAAWAEEAGFTP